jgi:hypothetical protein
VHGVPDGVDRRDLVGQEFDHVEEGRENDDRNLRDDLETGREVEHSDAMEKAERRDGRVKAQPRRDCGSGREPNLGQEILEHRRIIGFVPGSGT